MTITLTLPYPPSVNQTWRRAGKTIHLSAKAKEFRKRVAHVVAQTAPGIVFEGELAICIDAYPPNALCDVDNLQKATLDALAHAKVFANDRQVKRLLTEMWGVHAGGWLQVIIGPRQEMNHARLGV